MADITVTAANVLKGTDADIVSGIAGASITAGQSVYKDATDSDKIKLADANASLATADCIGIALHAAASGQPIVYQKGGDITIGATITKGGVYVVSATAGGIAPVADLTTGWYTKVIGIGLSTTVLTIINRGASTLVTV